MYAALQPQNYGLNRVSHHGTTGLCTMLAGLLALAWVLDARGYSQVRFERISMEQGLSQSAISAMAQDPDGFLWFGTQYGLDRYDGYRFENWSHDPDDPGTLGNSAIRDLEVSAEGYLWVANRGGLDRLDPRTGMVQRISLGTASGNSRSRPLFVGETPDGRLFVKTDNGPAILHPEQDHLEFLQFSPETLSPVGRNYFAKLDEKGTLWVADMQTLWRLDRDSQLLEPVVTSPGAAPRRIRKVLAATGDMLAWAGDRGLRIVDRRDGTIRSRIRPTEYGHASDRIHAVVSDSSGTLWITLADALVRFDPENGDWERLADLVMFQPSPRFTWRLQIAETSDGKVWLGGSFGIGLYEPDSDRFRLFRHDPNDPESPGPTQMNIGYRVFVDQSDTLWVGSALGGLSRFSPISARFETIRDRGEASAFAGQNVARGVIEQHHEGRELLWVALDSAGMRLMERNPKGGYRHVYSYHTLAEPDRRLPEDNVWGLARDPLSGRIWAATHGQLVSIDPGTGAVGNRIPIQEKFSTGTLNHLEFSSDGQSLMLGASNGLYEFRFPDSRRQPELHGHYLAGENEASRVLNLLETDSGYWLVASRLGAWLLDPEMGNPVQVVPRTDAPSHPANRVFGLAEYPEGTYWLGTEGGGLIRMIPGEETETLELEVFDELPDQHIYAILPDDQGRLWMSSNRGIIRFHPATGQARNYEPRDGVQDYEFSNTVAYRGQSGRFYFGGISGVNAFRPEAIVDHPQPPRVHLRQARVGDRNLATNGEAVPELDLDHDENDISLAYVGLHFPDPGRIQYEYRLDGLDVDWVAAGSQREVRYPGLPPGDYRFLVRAASSDGVWSDDHLLLQARVNNPPWMTPWAYAGYAAAGVLLLALAGLAQRQRRRQLEAQVRRRTAELAREKEHSAHQAVELDEALKARTILFANVSHEFRTPLTLIQASLDRARREGAQAETIETGKRYLKRLIRMVDQLLDLSHLRSSPSGDPNPAWSLDRLVSLTVEAFRSMADQHQIELTSRIESNWITHCDQTQVERILLNLITNAIKYTPPGGQVTVFLESADIDEEGAGETLRDEQTDRVRLSVADTGPGIARDDQDRIFERFHRQPAAEQSRAPGAGIGLALVREAAHANGGTVSLQSTPGKGSRFDVVLPATRGRTEAAPNLVSTNRLALDLDLLEPKSPAPMPATRKTGRGRMLGNLLVVEDNQDLRRHLVDILGDQWHILEAGNGQEGLDLARQQMPDLVVSDIMMPGMDGLELLRQLRNDIRTSHLPVLLLTARQDQDTRLEGYSLSADDFLAKPFDVRELQLRLERMLGNRNRIQERLRMSLMKQPASNSNTGTVEAAIDRPESDDDQTDETRDLASRDRKLLLRIGKWLQENHGNSANGIGDLAADLAMDTRTLQRKLKALTGQTPGAHLQSYRLDQATRLLRETDRTLQDIALSCGFSSAQYFSRVFRKTHGMPPNAWRLEIRGMDNQTGLPPQCN